MTLVSATENQNNFGNYFAHSGILYIKSAYSKKLTN